MKVKKYLGKTMQEAFDAVKRDLGPDAVILHTKTKKKNGMMGLLGKEMVEITASLDVKILNEPPQQKNQSFLEDLYKKQENSAVSKSPETSDDRTPTSRVVQYELSEIKSMLDNLMKRTQYSELSNLTDELMDFYLMLIQQQVSEELSKEIMQRLNNDLRNDELHNKMLIKDTLKSALSKMVKESHPIILDKPMKKVALIGPTGVGKTTTIAKLAANFALKEGKKVGLITIDTYRIAAVEQLRTYADIINIPLEVVLTAGELKRSLDKFKDFDLILVDTAGRSHKNQMQMSELKSYLDVMEPDEVHLVLSTVTNYESVMDTVERFEELSFDKLLFTKLDEAVNFGLILNVIRRLSKSLSYVTIGQNVPDDIEIGDPHYLAELLLGERKV